MRAQNKIAVGVGVVLIVLGIVYVRSKDKALTEPVADSVLPVDESVKTTVADNAAPPAGASRAPAADVASPTPKHVETVKFVPSSENPRPKPSVTNQSSPTVSVPVSPPQERAGLGSLPLALPTDDGSTPADSTPATPDTPVSDMPPNVVANEVTPRITVAPRVEPVAPKTETAPPIGAAATPPATARTHVVQKGDTYTSLAVKYLGHAKYAKQIQKANPGREANRLYVGSKINIPDATASTPPAVAANAKSDNNASAAKRVDTATKNRPASKAKEVIPPPDPSRAYVVQRGDSWQSVARKFLGKSESDVELYELNKERVGGDPHLLRMGLVIELPARAKMPAKTPPTTAAPAKPASPAK